MSDIINLAMAKKDLEWFDQTVEEFKKQAFVQAPAGPGALLTPPLGGPLGGPQGGPPMPPQGAPMGPQGAPMPPQGAPTGPQGAPPSEGPQGAIPPGLEQMLTELSGGVKNISMLTSNHDQLIAQLTLRLEAMEHMLDAQNKALKLPAGFEETEESTAPIV